MSETVHDLVPPLERYREMARQSAMSHFVEIALKDQRPDTQRAMDAVKAGEARLMLMPGSTYVSPFIEREAQIRAAYGQPVNTQVLARMIDAEADKLKRIELQRVEAAVGIDAAPTVEAIAALLARLGISLP